MTLPAFSAQGTGDTAVILLHGIGGGRSMWGDAASGTLAALATAGWRGVAVDLPGYGDSAAPHGVDFDAFVIAIDALIAHLAAARTVLVGHSMGGMVAQEVFAQEKLAQRVAARSPRRLHGLVLSCTSAAFGHSDKAWQSRFVAERAGPLDAGLGMAGMAALRVPQMVSPAASDEAVRIAIDVMSRVPEATYRQALQATAAFDRRTSLASIDVPTLVLAAEHDRTATPALMRRMAMQVAGSEYDCLARAGHIAPIEQPAAFNAALLQFLQSHFVGASSCTSPATPLR